jgi:hypothetical protein
MPATNAITSSNKVELFMSHHGDQVRLREFVGITPADCVNIFMIFYNSATSKPKGCTGTACRSPTGFAESVPGSGFYL